jgi:DNA-binding LacI/PurR family transcriptional regulator
MPTIHDVAQKAGVSIATVSRYFNMGYVSDKSRTKIEGAINELDYHVDIIARALSGKSSKTIGLIIPSITNPFFPELAVAVESEAASNGYKLILCNAGGSISKEEEFISMLLSHHADGIVTATGNCSEIYGGISLPVVSVDRNLSGNFAHVSSDNLKGGRMAVRHLYDCGCRRVLFIRDSDSFKSLSDREMGALEESRVLGIECDILQINDESCSRVIEENFESISHYDGIFAWNDTTAVQVLRTCYQHNIRVPGDIMLIGYDNIYISNVFIPSLTTIAQDIYSMGQHGTRILMDIIEGREFPREGMILDVKLIERETTC